MSHPVATDYKTEFHPRKYLNEYYDHIGDENSVLLKFLSRAYRHIFSQLPAAKVLEVGGGPTLYQLISLSQYPVEIHFSEYSEANLREVKKWLEKHPRKFPWRKYIRFVHDHEKQQSHLKQLTHREQHLRNKVTKLLSIDLKKNPPFDLDPTIHYDIVSTHFVAESITPHKDIWRSNIETIVNLTTNYLVMSAIIEANMYQVHTTSFYATPITIQDLQTELQIHGFTIIMDDFVSAEKPESQGYKGLYMVCAQKLANSTKK